MKSFCLPGTLLIMVSFFCAPAQSQTKVPQLGKDPVPAIIKAMTLEEKVKLVVGMGMNFGPPPSPANGNSKPEMEQPQGPALGNTKDKVPGASGTTFAIPRLGIPSIVVSDGPSGVRIDTVRANTPGKTYYATAFPTGTLLASSWDTSLVKKVGVAFGSEIKEYGIDIILGPGMNIQRDPLNGRNFEYFSEDPLVSGSMAAAMVNGIQSNGVGTSIKHFAANNQETDRNTVDVQVSERALREIYLRNFQLAVQKSQPWTVMSSYNLINGIYTSQNPELLTAILRSEWGFRGFVMSDWFGGVNAVEQMKAGNNLLMPGTKSQSDKIMDAVKSGALSEEALDENIAGILDIILKTPSFKGYKYTDKPDLKAHAKIAREAAAESMVLLKNKDNALPLQGVKQVALFGVNSLELIAGGTGSGDVNKAYKIAVAQGLRNAGYKTNKELLDLYASYKTDYDSKHPKRSMVEEFMKPTPPVSEYVISKDIISKKAVSDDVAVIVIGRNAGEGKDRKTDDDYYLSAAEKDMVKDVADVFHAQNKKVVVVLNIGGAIDVSAWRDNADAILLAWQPGLEGGNAIADIISGKVNPSGKLATTFPTSYNDEPSAKNFPGKEFPEKATTGMFGMKSIPAEVTYEEGVYVGYRYNTSFDVKPAYEFGYGLSYTNFNYSPVRLSASVFAGKITATITITNNGKTAGREVVELYLSAPGGKLNKPAEELKGFAKTALLQPGASQTITFTIKPEDLASFHTDASAWIADAGTYTVKIGASSSDIKSTLSFTLPKDIVTEHTHKVMMPKVDIHEMSGK